MCFWDQVNEVVSVMLNPSGGTFCMDDVNGVRPSLGSLLSFFAVSRQFPIVGAMWPVRPHGNQLHGRRSDRPRCLSQSVG